MDAQLDMVTLEVIRNALPAIANEMAADLQRTSYNMMIYEVRDFCTALVAPNGALISQNVGGVSHFVADLGVIITDGMARYGRDGFKPGDVIITNHQAVAGQHLNNIVIYTPYFFEGELLMFAMVRAHWIDVGGWSTGFGAGPHVPDPWLEGLQLNQLKIYREGEIDDTLYRVISDNIRFPESSLGDMKSQMAACRLAARRLDELFRKYGRDTILGAIQTIFGETERKCRIVVAQIPDGVYEAESSIDDDGVLPDDPVRLHAKVTVAGGHMTIDLSQCSGERKAGINSRTYAAARVAYKALTGPLDPVNEGSFSALDVIIPEGNIMMARYPAPMAGWSLVIPMVVDTIIKALPRRCRSAFPARITGPWAAPSCSSATTPRLGGASSCRASRAAAGAGGRARTANSATVSVCQGDVRNGSIEGIELKCPVLVKGRALRPDFGRGGPIPWRTRHRCVRREFHRRTLEFRAHAARQMPALGRQGRQVRRDGGLPAAPAAGERVPFGRRRPSAGAGAFRGDRAHRRRRRLGRSAAARPRARARRRARGVRVVRRRAQGLWRRAAAGPVARSRRDQRLAREPAQRRAGDRAGRRR